MAALAQIIATTHRTFLPEVADNFFTGIPLLESLMSDGKVKKTASGGRHITTPILAAAPTGGPYQGLDPFAATDAEETTAAEYNWMAYRAMPVISGLDDFKNSGPEGVINLWGTKMRAAGMKIKEDVATAMFADPTTADITLNVTPLEQIVDDGNTYTVGGLSSDDVALWQGIVNTGSGGALTLKMVEDAQLDCTEGQFGPTDIVFSKAGYTMLWSLLQLNQRYLGADKNVGFQNIMLDNRAKAYWDSHILVTGGGYTGQRALFLTRDFLQFYTGAGATFAIEDKTPTNADGYIAQIKLYCQLTCNARRFQGVLHNFTV